MNATTARSLWIAGNNAGQGYAPYTDVPGDNTLAAAVEAATNDGWDIVASHNIGTSDEIHVLRNADGEHMGIANSNGPWAVILSDVKA